MLLWDWEKVARYAAENLNIGDYAILAPNSLWENPCRKFQVRFKRNLELVLRLL